MRRSALGRKALTVLVSATMVVSMMPTAALADAVGVNDSTTEQSQIENEPGGGDSGNVAETKSADEGSSEGAANGQTTTEQGSTTQTGNDSQQGTGSQEPASPDVAEVSGKSYPSLQAAIDAATRNATVKLLADTYENVTISANAIKLDLNGHTLNGSTVKASPALTINNTRVTVQDSSEAQTGTIMREDTAENSGVSSHYVIDVQGKNGFLLFNGGTVKNNSGTANGAKGSSLVRVGNDSDKKSHPVVTIAGGTFTQDNFIAIKVDFGTLYVKGGVINSKNSYAVENWLNANIKDNAVINGNVSSWTYAEGSNSNLNISGGTVNGNVESVTYDGAEGKTAKVSITGGTVNGTLSASKYNSTEINDPTKATIEVTGGTFSTDPSRYLAENSAATKNEDGTYGVAKAYLAQVGEASCYTMDEAFKAQTKSGEAITLLRDYTTGSTFNSGTVARVVDLNGHTWTCTGTDASSAAFEINNPNASLTVKNGKVVSSQLIGLIPSAMGGTIKYDNSTLTFDGVEASTTATSGIETNGNNTNDTVVLKNSTLNVPNGFGIYFPSSGTLTIDNSTINAKTMGAQVCSGSLNVNAGSAITVSGDPVAKTENDGAIQDGAAISIVNRPGYKGLDKVAITGGTFKAKDANAAIKAYTWDSATKQESAFGNSANTVTVSGGTFSAKVPTEYCAEGFTCIKNSDGTYGVAAAAQIGDKNYASVQVAIDAANEGDTVKLLADAAEDVTVAESKNLTLDLNGFTLTNVKGHTITNNGTLTITDSSEAKTGTVDNLTNGKAPVENNQGATCTIAGGIFTRSQEAGKTPENSGGNSYYYIENFGTMAIGGDVKVSSEGHFSSLVHNGWYDGSKNTAKTNAVMTIDSGSFAGGINTIKNDDYGEITINGGNFKNATQHPLFNVNVATVNGGTFESSTNSAVYTKAYDDSADKGTTIINGGTFKSATGKNDFLVNDDTHKSTVAVSGGTFSAEVPAKYCAEGFTCVKNSNGTYGVAQKGEEVKPSEDSKNSGSVLTSGVTVDQSEQKKVAESASKAADDVKNVTVETGATETKIGDVTVDTTDKTNEVSAVVEAAKEENASVSVQFVVKAAQAATASDKIKEAVSEDSEVVPFELSVDMVTVVKAENGTTTTATVPVKETAQPITVTIKVDPWSIADKNVMVARDHGGVVELIEPSKVNYQKGEITFETAKFSDYAVVASEMNKSYKLEDYTDANGTRKTINNVEFNVGSDYAFAGWYKDPEFTQPYKTSDVSGDAYPMFVKIGEYIQYMGGSLRMDGPQASESTSLRFGYITSVPNDAKYIDSWWTWNDGLTEQEPVHAANRVLFSGGAALANLVVTTLQAEYYTTTFHVTEHLKYQTVDGTTVEVAETTSHQHSAKTVAKAVLDNPGASPEELAYAQQILDTIGKE